MASTESPEVEATKPKRAKTGGRLPKKGLDQMMAETRIRSELATMDDDTTLPADLAAIYLCISTKQLAELRKRLPSKAVSSKSSKDKSVKESPKQGLRMIKLTDKDAVGINQPVTYKLGDLRAYQNAHMGYDTFEAALASGILGWMSDKFPFFSKQTGQTKVSRPVIHSPAFGFGRATKKKEAAIQSVRKGELNVVWLTPKDAVGSQWSDEKAHEKLASRWIKILETEKQITESALKRTSVATSMKEVTLSKKPLTL